jgi:hypothetical protein
MFFRLYRFCPRLQLVVDLPLTSDKLQFVVDLLKLRLYLLTRSAKFVSMLKTANCELACSRISDVDFH